MKPEEKKQKLEQEFGKNFEHTRYLGVDIFESDDGIIHIMHERFRGLMRVRPSSYKPRVEKLFK